MRKHRTSSTGKQRWRDANRRLSRSASDYCRELTEHLRSESTEDYFAFSYLESEYLSKYNDESVTPAEVRRKAAILKWWETEQKNARTNALLRSRDSGWNIIPRVTWSSFLKFARKLTADILGPLDDSIVLGSYSGGASTSLRKTESSPARKFAGMADTTGSARVYVDTVYRQAPMLRRYGTLDYLREVPAAILFTVPKKTDIDRCACKEPDFNMYLQKGVGSHIRGRLRRFGVNLNDQNVNKELARKGALDGSLATLDLSSASDTITIECVRSLLPSDWFDYLNDIRSSVVDIDGVLHRTEMFSSMGNGFTFELESLLFYVIMRTTMFFEGIPGIVSVYGDDLIIPSEGFEMASWTLRSFGFTVNESKSFATGPFRESCGGHYHSTEDVTPFYLKRNATHLTDVIRLANQLRRWALADPAREYLMPSTYKVWTKLASFIPRDLWGGSDLASDTQLVCPVAPINRLVRLTEHRDEPELGKYLAWQNSSWKRTEQSEPEEGFDDVDTRTKCRKHRVRSGAPYCEHFFREEVEAR